MRKGFGIPIASPHCYIAALQKDLAANGLLNRMKKFKFGFGVMFHKMLKH